MMGEEIFQLLVATPSFVTRPMSFYKAKHNTSLYRSNNKLIHRLHSQHGKKVKENHLKTMKKNKQQQQKKNKKKKKQKNTYIFSDRNQNTCKVSEISA